jgi:hypothetical protein
MPATTTLQFVPQQAAELSEVVRAWQQQGVRTTADTKRSALNVCVENKHEI